MYTLSMRVSMMHSNDLVFYIVTMLDENGKVVTGKPELDDEFFEV